MAEDFRERAKLWPKGRLYEDFAVGEVRQHHWGRTIALSDTLLFTTLTLSFNPLYSNRVYAEAHGHPDIVVNPLLVFNTVLGMSVEDNSEIGGPFVGVGALTYRQPVYPGDTLTARSTQGRAALGQQPGQRHRHLAHRGLQPARGAGDRLRTLQPRQAAPSS
ncbi:MAG TPA: MaoC/PaaZ C-terminal domain-containing protein [Caulobacteraceae bacterium]|jgi:acyl dehydratase